MQGRHVAALLIFMVAAFCGGMGLGLAYSPYTAWSRGFSAAAFVLSFVPLFLDIARDRWAGRERSVEVRTLRWTQAGPIVAVVLWILSEMR